METGGFRTIPNTAGDLTPQWFSSMLDDEIIGVDLEALDAGVGFLARTLRARLTRGRGAVPTSVVVKFSTDGPARSIASSMGLYACEVGFYRDLADRGGVRVPECLAAEIDATGEGFVLLLDDLTSSRAGDQLVGATDDELAEAVATAARLHARWWGRPELIELSWLPSNTDLVARQLENAIDLYPSFADAWTGHLTDDELALGERVVRGLQPLVDEIHRPPFTLVHGDFRLDNLFFERDGGVMVIDWQMSFRGSSGAFDLALLLASSLSVPDRQRLMPSLVDHYVVTIRELGVDECDADALRRALAVAAGQLISRCPVAHQIPSVNDRAAAMRAALFRGYWDVAQHSGLADLLDG